MIGRSTKKDIFRVPDGHMKTLSGQEIDLSRPKMNKGKILLSDIAFQLAYQNRFNGACGSISVADHSIRVAEIVAETYSQKPETLLWALLHDAHEAYIGDLIHPLRIGLDMWDERGEFKDALEEYEMQWKQAIQDAFGLSPTPSEHEAVHNADLKALQWEFQGFNDPTQKPHLDAAHFMAMFTDQKKRSKKE